MDTSSACAEVTDLLDEWRQGGTDAIEKLVPLVYRELRAIASRYLARERQDHSLQPTELVHELFLRLFPNTEIRWNDRSHFFAISARGMRQILVDHARGKARLKRAGGVPRIAIEEAGEIAFERPHDLLRLDEALQQLALVDARMSSIVELRFFGGLTAEEISVLTGLSTATVTRHWRGARAWLFRELSSETDGR